MRDNTLLTKHCNHANILMEQYNPAPLKKIIIKVFTIIYHNSCILGWVNQLARTLFLKDHTSTLHSISPETYGLWHMCLPWTQDTHWPKPGQPDSFSWEFGTGTMRTNQGSVFMSYSGTAAWSFFYQVDCGAKESCLYIDKKQICKQKQREREHGHLLGPGQLSICSLIPVSLWGPAAPILRSGKLYIL